MSKFKSRLTAILTGSISVLAVVLTSYWVYFLVTKDGWGHLWFILLAAPAFCILSFFCAILPNLIQFDNTKEPRFKFGLIMATSSTALILIEAIISIVIPKVGC